MQLWTKLTIGFAATAALIVTVYGVYQLREEGADLRSAARRELTLTATAVQVAVGNALRDHQSEDVREIIDAVKVRDAALNVLVLDAAGGLTAGSWGSGGLDLFVRRAMSEFGDLRRPALRFEMRGQRLYLIGSFPIEDPAASPVGTLILVRSLDELQRDLSSETRATILSLGTLVVGLTTAGWILAFAYVRDPLQSLVQAMRAVRAGDLTAKAQIRRTDELGAAVTEFNAMMMDLIDARARLVREVDARASLEAKLQHTDKLITVGQLSAGLAHEIGSPLQVLNGRARALAARADIPPDIQRTAEILTAESDRITRIVKQLLTFARHVSPLMRTALLTAPIRDIIELLHPEAARQGVLLTFRHGDNLPPVTADVSQFQQVVMNLLTNALRATPRGGRIDVTLDTIMSQTAEGFVSPMLSLVVEDTGHGIADSLLPRVFEPFFTTQMHSGGTGLGLGIVKSIVEAHGGTVSLSTQVDMGTRVTVRVPVLHAEDDVEVNGHANTATPCS